MNELVKVEDLTNDIGNITRISWAPSKAMSYEEWAQIGGTFQQLGRSMAWWVGDWLNHGEARWGEMYTQALDVTGLSEETLSKYKRVALRVPAEIRREDLTWSHHFAVAYLDMAHREPYLEMAAHFELSSRELKEALRLSKQQQAVLIDSFMAGELQDRFAFEREVNRIRLEVEPGTSDGTIYNYQVPGPAAGETTPKPPSYTQAPMLDDEEAEEPVFIEEVMAYFDVEGARMTHCTSAEAGWGGLAVTAVLDKHGRPKLKWSKRYAE